MGLDFVCGVPRTTTNCNLVQEFLGVKGQTGVGQTGDKCGKQPSLRLLGNNGSPREQQAPLLLFKRQLPPSSGHLWRSWLLRADCGALPNFGHHVGRLRSVVVGVFITGQKLQIDQGFWVFPPDRASRYHLQACLAFIMLHRCCFFYKLKARLSPSKKIMTCFIAVVWNRICNISEVCLSHVTGSSWLLLHGNVGLDLSDILIVQTNWNLGFHIKFLGFKNFMGAK